MGRKLRVVSIVEDERLAYYIEEYIGDMWVGFVEDSGEVSKKYINPFDAIDVCRNIGKIKTDPEIRIVWEN